MFTATLMAMFCFALPAEEIAATISSTDITLRDAMMRALAHAPEMQRIQSDTDRTRAQDGRVFMVYTPRFDFRANYTRWEHKTFPDLNFGGVTVPSESAFPQLLNNYGLSASIDIMLSDYLWKMPSLHALAKQSHRVQLARARAEAEKYAWLAAQTYLTTLRDASATEVTEAAAATLKQRAERMKALQSAGEDVTEADVMRLKAEAARADAQAAQMRGQMQSERLRLAYMIDVSPENMKLVFDVNEIAQPLIMTVEEALLAAEKERAELHMLEEQAAKQDAQIKYSFSQMFPTLSVKGQYDYSNPNLRILPIQDKFQGVWQVQARAEWSPNDTVRANTEWNDAKIAKTGIYADIQAIRNAIAIEVRSAFTSWEAAQRMSSAAMAQWEAAGRAFRDLERLFAAGSVPAQQLLDGELAFRQAALARIDAAVSLHLTRLQFDKSIGRLTK